MFNDQFIGDENVILNIFCVPEYEFKEKSSIMNRGVPRIL